MCLICVDFKNGGLDVVEARNNMVEMMDGLSDEHIEEIEEMLQEAEEDEYWKAAMGEGFIDSLPNDSDLDDMTPDEENEFWRQFNTQWDDAYDDH
jgi:tripartite-type tricarboxylate transporter receptor subunit TctC